MNLINKVTPREEGKIYKSTPKKSSGVGGGERDHLPPCAWRVPAASDSFIQV